MIDRLEFAQALEQLDIAMERLRDNSKSTLICLNIDIEVIICKAYSAVCNYKLGRDELETNLRRSHFIAAHGDTKWTFTGAGHAISMLARELIARGEMANAEQVVYLSSACLICENSSRFFGIQIRFR